MGKAATVEKNVNWIDKLEPVLKRQSADKRQVKILIRKLNGLFAKHFKVQSKIDRMGRVYNMNAAVLKYINDGVDHMNKHKNTLSPKQKRLLKILQDALKSSLSDRIYFMEKTEYSHGPSSTNQETSNNVGTQAAKSRNRKLAQMYKRICRETETIERINKQTVDIMMEIRYLDNLIRHLNVKSHGFKVKPYLQSILWEKPANDMTATIEFKKNKSKRKIQMNIRELSVLKHIPELMPSTYHYLE